MKSKNKYPHLKTDNTIGSLELGLYQAEASLNAIKRNNLGAAKLADQQEWVNAIKEAIEWRKKKHLE